jgi:hypothetical protein
MKVCKFCKFMGPYGTLLADLPIVQSTVHRSQETTSGCAYRGSTPAVVTAQPSVLWARARS